MTTQEFIDAIKGMTVLELNDLVKACEEEFGVSAAAGVVVAAAGDAGAAAEEKTEFDVELTEVGPNRLSRLYVMLQVLDLRKLRKLLRELLRLLRKQLQKQRLMKSRLNLRLRVLYVLLSNFCIITNEFKNRADDKFARFFDYYSRNRHTSFAFVALTGSRFVLRTKAAHMGAVPASQAFS